MRQSIAQNQFGTRHFTGEYLVEFCPLPDIVECRTLYLGVGSTLGYATPDYNTRTGVCCARDPLIVFWSQTGIRNLKGIKDTELNKSWQPGQGTGHPYPSNQTLFSQGHQYVDQSFTLQRFRITTVKLKDVDIIGPQSPQTGLDVALDYLLFPDMVNLKMIFVLGVSTATLSCEIELAAPGADVLADALFADPVIG